MKKRVIGIMLIVMMFASTTLAYGLTYGDVNDNYWANGAISTMSQKGIVKGYPGGQFQPNGTVTYGELIKMALIADTGKDVGNSDSLTGNWAAIYYDTALTEKYFTTNDIMESELNNKI